MNEIIRVGSVDIEVITDPVHGRVFTTAEVAKGFAVSDVTVRGQLKRHADEVLAGQHWVVLKRNTPGGAQDVTMWTPRGILRLAMFIKRSDQARAMRDRMEELLYRELVPAPAPAPVVAPRPSNAMDRFDMIIGALGEASTIMRQHAEAIQKHDVRLDAVESRMQAIEAAPSLPTETAEIGTGFITIQGWCRIHDITATSKAMAGAGRMCVKRSTEWGFPAPYVGSVMHGQVRSYRAEVLMDVIGTDGFIFGKAAKAKPGIRRVK